jgi:hypothetical protein
LEQNFDLFDAQVRSLAGYILAKLPPGFAGELHAMPSPMIGNNNQARFEILSHGTNVPLPRQDLP